ncbi:MAG: HEAT repeat domain-containing protein [Gemmatimonadaceae bacterium]|nr:HEAT repeat domain-containing protein [Gemmatimonadaceae bacterium]
MDTSILDARAIALMPVLLIVLKATAVLLVALALTTLMQRASATSRHLVWVASLFAMLVIPALALWSPIRLQLLPATWGATAVVIPVGALESGGMPTDASDSRTTRASDAATPTATTPASAAMSAASSADVTERKPLPLTTIIALVWAAVAVGILGWLGYGASTVRRIVRGATKLDSVAWQGPMMDIADRLELTEVPVLLRADNVTMPFACGLRTPTIVMPADCEKWNDERRTAVLLHELAHIRRRDIVGHTLGRIVCALYWFHPLAWMAARRLRSESERACDDLALSCGTRASDYAEHLLDIVTSVRNHGTPSVAMAMATRSEFEGRMLAILDPHLSRSSPTRVQASTLAGGVMMFAIVTGSAVPRVTSAPQLERPAPSRSNDVAVLDTVRRDDTRVDTMTVKSEFTDERRRGGPMPAPAPSAKPGAVAVATAQAQASPEPVIALATGVQGDGLLRSLPSARTAGDSSARASVLARILRTDTSASLRRTAAWGLNDFVDNDAARDALLYAVRQDVSAEVREMAAWALADGADNARVARTLGDVIRDDRNKAVRKTAVWALGDGGEGSTPGVVSALTSALTDDDAAVRELGAWGLGNSNPRRAPAALISALTDRDARVRATVAWALFEIEDGDAAAALETALSKETDADTKWAMVRAISVMGERAVAPLQRIIEGSDAAARALAIRSLAGRSDEPWPQPRPRPRPYP